mmetsp:Transcript_9443/g.30043  ORF Transcript_9443/g.30043 Transcript_9443/m.30043 type:complete len:202 (+) Transcript_9443:224-829(+)
MQPACTSPRGTYGACERWNWLSVLFSQRTWSSTLWRSNGPMPCCGSGQPVNFFAMLPASRRLYMSLSSARAMGTCSLIPRSEPGSSTWGAPGLPSILRCPVRLRSTPPGMCTAVMLLRMMSPMSTVRRRLTPSTSPSALAPTSALIPALTPALPPASTPAPAPATPGWTISSTTSRQKNPGHDGIVRRRHHRQRQAPDSGQ